MDKAGSTDFSLFSCRGFTCSSSKGRSKDELRPPPCSTSSGRGRDEQPPLTGALITGVDKSELRPLSGLFGSNGCGKGDQRPLASLHNSVRTEDEVWHHQPPLERLRLDVAPRCGRADDTVSKQPMVGEFPANVLSAAEEQRETHRVSKASKDQASYEENCMAKALGIGTGPEDRDLWWIVQEAVSAELPQEWYKGRVGEIAHYCNVTTGEITVEHPLKLYFKCLAVEEKAKRNRAISKYAEMLGIDVKSEQDLMWIAHEGAFAPLPFNWKKEVSKEDGHTYFYNTLIGRRQREHPYDCHYRLVVRDERLRKHAKQRVVAISELASLPKSFLPLNTMDAGDTRTPKKTVDTVDSNQQAVNTLNRAHTAEVDEKSTPLEKETAQCTEDELRALAPVLGLHPSEDGDLLWIVKEFLERPLPPGWQECQDAASGELYFFNYDSGQSATDHPLFGDYLEKVKKARRVKQTGDKQAGGPEDTELLRYAGALNLDPTLDADLMWIAKEAMAAPMPAGWCRRTINETSQSYYFNYLTGQNLWVHPNIKKYQKMAHEAKQDKDCDMLDYAESLGIDLTTESDLVWIAREALSEQLPPHWNKCVSDCGSPFYFNTATKENSWEHPLKGLHLLRLEQERQRRKRPPVRQSGLKMIGGAAGSGQAALTCTMKKEEVSRNRKALLNDIKCISDPYSQASSAHVPLPNALPAQAPPAYVPLSRVPLVQGTPAQVPPPYVQQAQAPTAQLHSAPMPIAHVPAVEVPSAQVPPGQVTQAQVPSAQVPSAQTPPARMPSAPMPTHCVPRAHAPSVHAPSASATPASAPAAQVPAAELLTTQVPIAHAPAASAQPAAQAPAAHMSPVHALVSPYALPGAALSSCPYSSKSVMQLFAAVRDEILPKPTASVESDDNEKPRNTAGPHDDTALLQPQHEGAEYQRAEAVKESAVPLTSTVDRASERLPKAEYYGASSAVDNGAATPAESKLSAVLSEPVQLGHTKDASTKAIAHDNWAAKRKLRKKMKKKCVRKAVVRQDQSVPVTTGTSTNAWSFIELAMKTKS